MKVSCTIPTRGDQPLEPIVEPLGWCDEIIVWDNSKREDMGPFGRFSAIAECKHDLIYTQDDDVIFRNGPALLELWEPGKVATNYQEPWDIPWHGRGAIFHRDLPAQVWGVYGQLYPLDAEFRKYIADGIFSMLTDNIVVDLGYEDMPCGFDPGRLSTSPGWYDGYRPEIQRRARELGSKY